MVIEGGHVRLIFGFHFAIIPVIVSDSWFELEVTGVNDVPEGTYAGCDNEDVVLGLKFARLGEIEFLR